MLVHHVTPATNLQSFLDNLDPLYFHTIYLSKGIYRQKVKLTLSNVTLIGEGSNETILIYNDYSYKLHADGLLYNTFRTATLTITGTSNKLKNLAIENDSGHSPLIGQAIALAIYGNYNIISHCNIIGNQDTLFIGPLPEDLSQRYAHILPPDERLTRMTQTTIEHTTIIGNIDFIFGSGNCLFKRCKLIFNDNGYLAAPSTYQYGIGFVFFECNVSSLRPEYQITLARAWREYGKVTFIHTDLTKLNITSRYDAWDKSHFEFREYPYIKHALNLELDDLFKQNIIDLFFT